MKNVLITKERLGLESPIYHLFRVASRCGLKCEGTAKCNAKPKAAGSCTEGQSDRQTDTGLIYAFQAVSDCLRQGRHFECQGFITFLLLFLHCPLHQYLKFSFSSYVMSFENCYIQCGQADELSPTL